MPGPSIFSNDGKNVLKNLFQLGGPVALQYLLNMGIWTMPVFFLGRNLPPANLGAYSLGNMFCNFTGNALIQGFLSNMDTHLSQAFGAKKFVRYQIVTKRNFLICSILAVVIGFIWFFVPEVFFQAIGVQDDVSKLAIQFCRIMILSVWPIFAGEVLHRFLANQNIVIYPTLVYVPMILASFLINYFYTDSLGFIASAVSLVVGNIIMFILFFVYVVCKGTKVQSVKLRGPVNYLKGWSEIFRFGIPGMLMMMMDWGTFELNAAYAGRINDLNLAAHALLTQTCGICYVMPLGIAIATQIIVGQKLGERKRSQAILASKIGFLVSIVLIGTCLIFIYTYRVSYLSFFTTSKSVIAVAEKVVHMQVAFSFFDAVQCSLTFTLRGVGKQDIAWKFMLGYPIIGLTSGYIYAFVLNFGLLGVWMGMVTAISIVDVCLFVLLYHVDWKKEEALAIQRATGIDASDGDIEQNSYSLIDCKGEPGEEYLRIGVN